MEAIFSATLDFGATFFPSSFANTSERGFVIDLKGCGRETKSTPSDRSAKRRLARGLFNGEPCQHLAIAHAMPEDTFLGASKTYQ